MGCDKGCTQSHFKTLLGIVCNFKVTALSETFLGHLLQLFEVPHWGKCVPLLTYTFPSFLITLCP